MVELQPVDRVIEAARFLRKEGCDNIGLGAYTSIVGHGGKEVAEALKHGVTTGNSLTAATGVEGLLAAATKVGYDVQDRSLKALVIGGGGSIGRVCAHLLKEQMGGEILLAGRDRTPLEKVAKEIGHRAQILQLSQAIAQADLIVTVTSATGELDINPSLFKSGAVVLDIARPRDIGEAVRKSRTDILVIDGAILSTPNSADMGFDFGFPQGTVYACMAETLVLTLEGVKDNYSIGRDLDLIRVKHIAELAKKHGFKLCSWRGSDEVIPDSKFDQIRQIVTNRRK
jgi:predicted amino acid dehydrogenase